MDHPFTIRFLDHVAIRVNDMERSAEWYRQVLGLKKYQFREWGPFPVFLLAGKTGIALFPANTEHPALDPASRNVKIDHFAFNVDRESFDRARRHYEQLGIEYTFQDHQFFHSIYTRDPDGHVVELTTIVVEEENFYQ